MMASHRVLCTKSHTVRSCLCLTAMRRMLGEGYEAVGEQRMQGPQALCWYPVLWAERLASLRGSNARVPCHFPQGTQLLKNLVRVNACEALSTYLTFATY